MGSFAGLNIGLSSLLAQRRALEVTGHNLANVGSDGYSRQRVEMSSDAGPITPALWARYEGAGNGVRSGSITRMRDEFLELRGYQEHAAESHLAEVKTTFERVEGFFAEPSDTGLAAQLADFWAGWDDIANRPDDLAARAQLIERAGTLTTSFQRLDTDLQLLRSQSVEQVDALVSEVNSTASRIAALNGTIQSALASNLNANDLMDQRDVLVSKLADTIGVTVRPGDAGTLDVFVGGTALVRGTRSEELRVTIGSDPAQTVSVNWVKDGLEATMTGRVGGLLDTINDVVPRYRADLTAVAAQMRDETNAVHVTGYDLNGDAGVAFFVDTPTGVTVNPAVKNDPNLIAAASTFVDLGGGVTAGTSDGKVAAKLAQLTGADTTYRKLVVALGVEAQSANRRAEIQSAITLQIDGAREAEAGVNLDEEMTNLIAYQHAYSAAARFVTAVDETIETLINLGR
jgi:flagellar hook-associated protein 1 FlgK